MPEYLTPGVYVEETSFRSRAIEGVATSTCGMVGATQYGPVPYPADVSFPAAGGSAVPDRAKLSAGPKLVTSFTEYERLYGGLAVNGQPSQVALAARGFFANGGRRLYVQRVYHYPTTTGANPVTDVAASFASLNLPAGRPTPVLVWRARWPGSVGARIKVVVRLRRSKNILVGGRLTNVLPGAAVETAALAQGRPPEIPDTTAPVRGNVRLVVRNDGGELGYDDGAGGFIPVNPNQAAFHLNLDVEVHLADRVDAYSGTELGPRHSRSIFTVLSLEDPADEGCLVWLHQPPPTGAPSGPGDLLDALLTLRDGAYLTGGGDGSPLTGDDLQGRRPDFDNVLLAPLGLGAMETEEDIAIMAMPDTVTLPPDAQPDAVDRLIAHCERMRYRVAVVDPPKDSSVSEVRAFRSRFDTTRAALYYPWLRIIDPTRRPDPGMPPPTLDVPPSGYVAGVYARTDVARGVHKAPANETLLGVTAFVTTVTFDRQSVLNPEGVNALRFFEGRANRVWGARTMSSDPEWKYVNVRRLFNYLEASIERSTQWAVFEPNNERLWGSIRQSVEDFLLTVWRTGALMGTRAEDAYFVRCDRTTMTQNDLDNGRLICLIGVSPTYPAEFVIFRIGQWTADARR
ncbi:phage tail sheath subtilisin-like domain-containing protein [Georgenia sp. 10Sc9-8]|uniref:Phage tail sheath subtilisin-like domain-containing protein n=1 Tax=Georgenia halotolerans TaxID=3028317 RepID=A0ABT5TZW4_9MICO|nr:phage tail sheath subtilisin-like domain-containing protein [Georgenia halotolerans]